MKWFKESKKYPDSISQTEYKEFTIVEYKLEPGEKKSVSFILTPDHLSFLDAHLEPVVEPGKFDVMVGSSSADIRLRGEFEVKK